MRKFLKSNLLSIAVFITGACVLIVEIVATRVLSPHFGNTIFTYSSVISVILAALSVGYYWGGKLADNKPLLQWFFGIILISSIVLLGLHFLGTIILPLLSYLLPITIGPLVTSALLFFLPAVLLGMLSPYAVKLQTLYFPKQGVGSIAGNIFFWSTMGSICGSLLAGFVLIPNFGIDHIFIANSVVLFFLGLLPLMTLGLKRKHLYQALLIIGILITLTITSSRLTHGGVQYSKDGVYEKITVYDSTYEGRPTRFFKQDRSYSGAMFLDSDDPNDLVYDYTKYYAISKVFNPEMKTALVIGGGAYSIPKALLEDFPNVTVEVSEIEPVLFELAKNYFQVPDTARLKNSTVDGRRFLHDSSKKYDLIFSDVYYSLYSIPPHFTTQEFFTEAKEKLRTDGIFVANLLGDLSRQSPSLAMSEIKTFQTVFPNSYFFAVTSPQSVGLQNIILVGYNSDKKVQFDTEAILKDKDPVIRTLREKSLDLNRYNLSAYPILTDTFSPVEHLTARVLQRTYANKQVIDGTEMLAIVDQQLRYGPRYAGSPGHEQMQKFLLAEMQTLTPAVEVQTWEHTGITGEKLKLKNVIARLYPDNEHRVILATHYDSKKLAANDPSDKTRPVPGANDSASGVAILVELARIFSNSDRKPNVGVDIIFFDGEEGEPTQTDDYTKWKPLGSTYFIQHLDELYKTNKPKSGVVVDMVCDKNLKIYKELSSVRDAPAEVEAFWSIAKEIDGNVFSDQNTHEILDDHTPLNQAGIPTFLLIDYAYPPFHTTEDTLDKCNPQSLQTVARAVFEYIYSLK